jgi:methyl-accepting chemotaxis protein
VTGISKIITSIEADDEIDEPPRQTRETERPIEAPKPPLPPKKAPLSVEHLKTYDVDQEPQTFEWIKRFTLISAITWFVFVGILLFFVLNIGSNWQGFTPIQGFGVIGAVLAPIFLIGLTAYALKQLARLSTQSKLLEIAAERLSQPDQLILQKTETMAGAIAAQIDGINSKFNEGLGRISALDDVLETQTKSINATNQAAAESADSIGKTLDEQKQALLVISTTFDESMAALATTMQSRTQELADATRMAEQKIKEARISVEGATAKINSASDVVRSNTVQAASNLSQSHEEIKALGDIIKQRSDELDDVYRKHANDLSAMIEHLRDEQQNLGANMEDTLVKMRDLSLSAQSSAESLADASSSGKETIEALAQSASLADNAVKTRFAEMEQMVRYSTEHAQNIGETANRRVQDSLEHTRKEISRIELDMAELQDKLIQSAASTPEIPVVDTPSAVEEARKRRRSRLHVQPIEEAPEPEGEPQNEPIPVKQDDIIETLTRETPELVDPDIPEPPKDDTFELQVETPDEDDLVSGSFEVDSIIDAIRPVAEYDAGKKAKTGFSLRGLFGGSSKQQDDEGSLSIASAEKQQPAPSPEPQNNDREFLDFMSSIGLAPNVIVDDGCVIEAANNRSSKGHDEMSRCVIERLNSPVKHFAGTLSSDADLSQKTIDFATDFDRGIESLSGDREAIRSRLESESGRAYLLCDAALNYGRV